MVCWWWCLKSVYILYLETHRIIPSPANVSRNYRGTLWLRNQKSYGTTPTQFRSKRHMRTSSPLARFAFVLGNGLSPVWCLTLNILNCIKYYKRYIQIYYHILHWVQQQKNKITMKQSYMLPFLYFIIRWWICISASNSNDFYMRLCCPPLLPPRNAPCLRFLTLMF